MLRCSLINKFEANVFGNILVQLLQYYMTCLNFFKLFFDAIFLSEYLLCQTDRIVVVDYFA